MMIWWDHKAVRSTGGPTRRGACLACVLASLVFLPACSTRPTGGGTLSPGDFAQTGGNHESTEAQARRNDVARPDAAGSAGGPADAARPVVADNADSDPAITRPENAPAEHAPDAPADLNAKPSDNAANGPVNHSATGGTKGATNGSTLAVDAMVGQVNGRALYANEVLEPIDAQLRALAARLEADVFRIEAKKLIALRTEQIVFDALLLGEAERDLTDQERSAVRLMMDERRGELVRQFGGGSPTVADRALRAKSGKDLEQTLTDIRQAIIIKRYLSKKLLPKINVRRKEIEQYYEANKAEFAPPAGRVLRLIQVVNEADADRIDAALREGQAFAEVAQDAANGYNPREGGLMSGRQPGDRVFAQDALNEAMMTLKAGEHSPRTTIESPRGPQYWWVFVESLESGKGMSLAEAQPVIEQRLRLQRYQVLSKEYRERVFREGSYNPIDEMVRAVLEVAMSRYAQRH